MTKLVSSLLRYLKIFFLDPCESEEWKYFQGYCYWSSLYHQSPLHHRSNWFNAARECRKRDADLASIQNPGENHMVFTLNRCADAWTGLVMVDSNLKTSQAGFAIFSSHIYLFFYFYTFTFLETLTFQSVVVYDVF